MKTHWSDIFEEYKEQLTTRFVLRPVHKRRLPRISLYLDHRRRMDLYSDNYHHAVWPGAVYLAQYILRHPKEFNGKQILDIGGGSGILSIAVAQVGGFPTLVDNNIKAIYSAQINAAANGITITTLHADATALQDLDNFDGMLLADMLYHRTISDGLDSPAHFIQRALTHKEFAVYIADTSSSSNVSEPHWPKKNGFAREGISWKVLKEADYIDFGLFTHQLSAIKITSPHPDPNRISADRTLKSLAAKRAKPDIDPKKV